MSSKRVIFGLTEDELKKFLIENGFPKFTYKQIIKWVYTKYEFDPENFSDISKGNRVKLRGLFSFDLPKVMKLSVDPADGTKKYLLKVGKYEIETVLIKERDHYTQCISTQIGCPLGCKFCITGTLGLKRNLTTSEIVAQVLAVINESGIKPRNIVYMGMGEPLLNFGNVIRSIEIFTNENGLDFGFRKLTISTVGILDKLKILIKRFPKIGIAVSLNQIPEEREDIMPVEKQYPIIKVIELFKENKKIRPTFEFVLIKGVNSSDKYAHRLLKLLKGVRCKINLIPYNENKTFPYESVSERELNNFINILYKGPNAVTVRRSKGKNIKAACGQLAGEKSDK